MNKKYLVFVNKDGEVIPEVEPKELTEEDFNENGKIKGDAVILYLSENLEALGYTSGPIHADIIEKDNFDERLKASADALIETDPFIAEIKEFLDKIRE